MSEGTRAAVRRPPRTTLPLGERHGHPAVHGLILTLWHTIGLMWRAWEPHSGDRRASPHHSGQSGPTRYQIRWIRGRAASTVRLMIKGGGTAPWLARKLAWLMFPATHASMPTAPRQIETSPLLRLSWCHDAAILGPPSITSLPCHGR